MRNYLIFIILVYSGQAICQPNGKVIISEVYSDPTPSNGLPEYEYMELYNGSQESVNLNNWKISDGTATGIISDVVLQPNEYLILCQSASKAHFEPFGKALALTSWPILNNKSDNITLRNESDELVDAISYNLDVLPEKEKSNGGWSVEIVDPRLFCRGFENWQFSEHPIGGTPGTENSVYKRTPDEINPFITNYYTPSSNLIEIHFNEPMDGTSLENGNYELVGNEITDITVFEGNQRMLLTLKNHLEAEKNYSFQISNIFDCNANEMEESKIPIIFDVTPPELSNIIFTSHSSITCVFNEMLDPTAAGLSTNYYIDNYHPLTAQVDNNKVLLSFENYFELEKSYLLKISGVKDKSGNVIGENFEKEFVFSTAIDSIIIHDPHLISVIFKIPLLLDSLSIEKILLDQVETPSEFVTHPNNPTQISLRLNTALKSNSWKTISFINIYDLEKNLLQTPAHTFYYDTKPPQLYEIIVLDSTRLELVFNERLDLHTAVAVNNFETTPDLKYPYEVLALNDSTLQLIFSTPFTNEKTYQLSIDNIQDIYKNRISRKISSSFIFDKKSPQLLSIKVKQGDQLILQFSEPLANECLLSSNFKILPDGLFTTSIDFLPWDSANIVLKFQQIFPEADDIKIQILNLKDKLGNQSTGITEKVFSTINPKIAEIEIASANEIRIVFSEDIQMSIALQEDCYVLNDSLKAIELTEISPSEILCKFPKEFQSNTIHEIKIKEIEDKYGNQSFHENASFIYEKNIINLEVLDENMIRIEFLEPLDESSITTAKFSFFPEPGKPVVITKDANNTMFVKVLFDQSISENKSYTLEISGLNDIFGRRIPSETATFTYDNTPPAVNGVKCVLPQVVEITFSEPLDKKSAENNYFFILPECGSPIKSSIKGNSQEKVWLEFSCPLQKGKEYDLLLSGISDMQGNAIVNQEISFAYLPPREPEYNDLLITEIMPNTVDNKIFTYEYLEIYNRTSDTINLLGIQLSDRVKDVLLPEYDLNPAGYVILVPSAAVGEYAQFGEVLGIGNWPDLNDQDDDLTLCNRNGELIFTVSYKDNWYKNSSIKKSHSLEMIDVLNPCAGYYNWTASVDPSGGTPGRQNSVKADNPDLTSPKIIKAIAPDGQNIIICFNEKLQPQNLEGLFTIDPTIEIKTIAFDDSNYEKLLITTKSPLEPGIQYQISIKSLSDCAGNILKTNEGLATFQVCEPGLSQNVLFSEILFDPRAGGVDFIEIFNNQKYPIDLKNWSLRISDNFQMISSDHLVINPGDFLVLTTDPEILKADYPKGRADKFFQMKNMQNLVNEQGNVVLSAPAGFTIDSLYYSDKMHLPLLKSTKGVSLERLSYEMSTVDPDNWKSASENASFATPGLINSQSKSDHMQKGLFTVSPETFSPDDPGGRNHTFIHYDLESPDFIATISVYDRMGRVVKELAKNESLGISGSFRWDGYDFTGKRASAGYYIILIQAFNLTGETLKIKEKVAVAH